MASEEDDALRAMATHRGFRLVKSRRRKPGGDFGRYGLKDANGKAAFGFDGDALTARPKEIEAFLRDTTRETWTRSAAGAKSRKAAHVPPPKPVALPKPARPAKPRFKPSVANLLAKLPAAKRAEVFTELVSRTGVRLERIVSRGQSTPEATPMVQDRDEWVLLLDGAAGIRIEDSPEVELRPGDYLLIAAGQKHWVIWTARDRPTVWLALHFT